MSEKHEAVKFNEVIRALRRQKNDALMMKEDEIEGLRKKFAINRRQSLEDKEAIDKLHGEIENKNIKLRNHEDTLKKLEQKEKETDNLKKKLMEMEKGQRLEQELQHQNAKLHKVNRRMEREVSNVKQHELDAVKQRCSDIEIKAEDQENASHRLRDQNELLASQLHKANVTIGNLKDLSAVEEQLLQSKCEEQLAEIARLQNEVASKNYKFSNLF